MSNSTVPLLIFCLLFFVLARNEAKESKEGTKKAMPKVYEDNGKFVFVYDNLFRKDTLRSHLNLVSMGNIEGMLSPWQYSYSDYYFNIKTANSTNNIPWISPFEVETFMKSALWMKIAKVAKVVSGGKDYLPFQISTSMVRRLDFITVENDSEKDDELIVKVLLTPNLKKNDYGEVMFYKQDGEMLASVFHKFGRLLVWNASLSYVYKPPAMSYKQGIYGITIRLTTSKDKFESGIAQAKKQIEEADRYNKLAFPLSDDLPVPELDYGRCLKRKVHDSKGRVVSFFDGLFTKGDLDALRLFMLHFNSAYAYQGYDESKVDTEHDNVSWIAAIKVAKFVQSRLWKMIKGAVAYVSDEKDWYPYDVSMNIIRNSHYTRIHEDCETHEDEFTVLLYLTPDWKEDNYGETIFLEELLQPNGRTYPKGKQKYDWLVSVKPMYGRLVVFRGIIPHSARPPSPGFMGARYTFACKVSKNYHIAHAKMLRESIENSEPGDPDFELNNELLNQEYDVPTPEKPTEFLEKELAKRQQGKEDNIKELKMSVLNEVTNAVS